MSVLEEFTTGDVGRAIALLTVQDQIPSVGSSEFYVLRRKADAPEISAETLLIYLRAKPVQTILKWCQDGSQHPRFSERDLMAIPLPERLIDLNTELKTTVTEAFARRSASINMFAAAKRVLEAALDEGEEPALRQAEQLLQEKAATE